MTQVANEKSKHSISGTIILKGKDPHIYKAAEEYYAATKVMNRIDHTYPYLTNLGFAIELYIKCLDVTTEISSDANSSNLLAGISLEGGGVAIDRPKREINVKAKQTKKRKKRTSSHLLSALFSNHCPKLKQFAIEEYQLQYQSNLVQDLETLGEPFVYWRYEYEKVSSHTEFHLLNQVADFFHDFAGSLETKVFFDKAAQTSE